VNKHLRSPDHLSPDHGFLFAAFSI
jgi:hypothetical protein